MDNGGVKTRKGTPPTVAAAALREPAVTGATRTRRLKILRPLKVRDFALLWTGMTVSIVGDGIYMVALPFLVYEISNLPTALAAVGPRGRSRRLSSCCWAAWSRIASSADAC